MPKTAASSSAKKWSKHCTAAKRIVDLFISGALKPTDATRETLLALKASDPIFSPYSNDRFVINVSNVLKDLQLNEELKGKRTAFEALGKT